VTAKPKPPPARSPHRFTILEPVPDPEESAPTGAYRIPDHAPLSCRLCGLKTSWAERLLPANDHTCSGKDTPTERGAGSP
jgi:hypothetical protein